MHRKSGNIMESYKIIPPSDDLAARIIARAANTEQYRQLSVGGWIKKIFRDLGLPEPSYALAMLLMVGFIAGVSVQSERGATTETEALYSMHTLYDDNEATL